MGCVLIWVHSSAFPCPALLHRASAPCRLHSPGSCAWGFCLALATGWGHGEGQEQGEALSVSSRVPSSGLSPDSISQQDGPPRVQLPWTPPALELQECLCLCPCGSGFWPPALASFWALHCPVWLPSSSSLCVTNSLY